MRHGLMASATEGGLGTPLWTAPEQGKGGDHVRPSVDVWALGLLTFYLLTGKIYWFHCNDEKASMLDIATEMLRDDIAPASVRAEQLDCAAALPSGFDPWFSRCVVRDAELRYGDAAEAVMEWQRVLAGQPLVGKSTPPPATSSPPLVSIPSAPPPHSVVSRSEPPETIRSLYPEAHRPRNIVFAALAAVLAGIVAAAAAWMWLT
jgi:serine/threonine protein kinase